jgi:DHA2 family multidrug resistance protein
MTDATHPGAVAAAPAQPIPWFGLAAVLLGTFISTLNGRLSTFGLSDIRGAVHAGYDEGAWIPTAQTTAQMLIMPLALWLGSLYGARRVLIAAALAYAALSLLEPFSTNLPTLLAFQFAGGLASGFFIPLTISFILRGMPPKYWAYGVALYALNLELSLNISASLEGWYIDNLSWRWIFWQTVPLALGMAACLKFGTPVDPTVSLVPPKPDWFGLTTGGLGMALIYAALDQGNRLDWLNAGLVWGLLAAGGVLLLGFLAHGWLHPSPAIKVRIIFSGVLPRLLLLITFLRLTILATAYLIPQYLGAVRGFRAPQVGETLIWVAAPQLGVCALAGFLLRRLDARIVACSGFILIAIACFEVARGLTPLWSSDQFMGSLMLQALGQSLAISAVVFFAILHIDPTEALTFGGGAQTARLLGGEIGTAFMATLVRVRGQIASNNLGLHVQTGDPSVLQRLHVYGAIAGRGSSPDVADGRAFVLLDQAVRRAATAQSVIDGFIVIAGLTALVLAVMSALRPAPAGPASHLPLFARSGPPSPAVSGARP